MALGDITPSLWVCFVLCFEHFLFLSGTTNGPGLFYIFIAPAVESAIFPGALVPFFLENGIRNHILGSVYSCC